MILNPTNIDRFFASLNTAYNMQYNAVPTFHERFATTYPCTSTTWLTAYLTQIDNFRIWKGSRHVRTPAPMTYQVTPLPWELTVEIDTFLLQDDQFAIYGKQAEQLGEKARKVPDQALRDLLEGYGDFAGAAQTSLDEVTHWNSAHPVDFWDAGKGTYCNDFGTAGVSVNGVTVGGTFSTAAYSTVWEEMSTRKDESGEVDGVIADLLMVPPQLHFSAKQITQGQLFAGPAIGGRQPLQGLDGSAHESLPREATGHLVHDAGGRRREAGRVDPAHRAADGAALGSDGPDRLRPPRDAVGRLAPRRSGVGSAPHVVALRRRLTEAHRDEPIRASS